MSSFCFGYSIERYKIITMLHNLDTEKIIAMTEVIGTGNATLLVYPFIRDFLIHNLQTRSRKAFLQFTTCRKN